MLSAIGRVLKGDCRRVVARLTWSSGSSSAADVITCGAAERWHKSDATPGLGARRGAEGGCFGGA